VSFALIDRFCDFLPRVCLCRLRAVTDRDLRAWRGLPLLRHQRIDMALLMHIRDQQRASWGSYDRPQIAVKLKKLEILIKLRCVHHLL
jgi:hypothetical protein